MKNMDQDQNSGGIIVYEAERLSTEYAIEISNDILKKSDIYSEIVGILRNDDMARLYFQILIKHKVHPTIYNLLNMSPVVEGINTALLNDGRRATLLKAIYNPLPAKYKAEWVYKAIKSFDGKQASTIKDVLKNTCSLLDRHISGSEIDRIKTSGGMIAIKYGEGLDLRKRSDIFWVVEGGVDPKRVVMFFQNSYSVRFRKYSALKPYIEKFGFKYVCLESPFFNRDIPVWHPKKRIKAILRTKPRNRLDAWIRSVGLGLIERSYYWADFIRDFNIKIMFSKDEGWPESTCQRIAFGINGAKSGLLCGHQRSELFYPPASLLGRHPKDVLFTWSGAARGHFTPNVDHLSLNIVTGYPFSAIYKNNSDDVKKYAEALKSGKNRLIVTLFDNISGGMNNPISTQMAEVFYSAFLNWLIEDDSVAVIVKSKKKLVFQKLNSIKEIIRRAKQTNRCVFIEEGRLPAEASKYSDFAVGIGISSAVMEAVLAGCRGIHCDLTLLRSNHFYKLGYEKIIFDDIGRLISALKRYKENPKAESRLGDWSAYLNTVDPFNDKRGGERIGSYVKCFVECFDKGMGFDEAIEHTNTLYAEKWGKDKVIDLRRQDAES